MGEKRYDEYRERFTYFAGKQVLANEEGHQD